MSADFVPGLILLDAPCVKVSGASSLPCTSMNPTKGDFGPIWSSAMGGGLGRRGELVGDIAIVADVQTAYTGREVLKRERIRGSMLLVTM
jgi:hypothetical protein